MKCLKKQPHDERMYFGDHRRASKVKREDWESTCGVIFPKDPPSGVFAADSNVIHLPRDAYVLFTLARALHVRGRAVREQSEHRCGRQNRRLAAQRAQLLL